METEEEEEAGKRRPRGRWKPLAPEEERSGVGE